MIAAALAVLTTPTLGHCTAMVTAPELLSAATVSLVEATLAVLLMSVPQSLAVLVVVVKVMVRVLLGGIGLTVPKLQVSRVPPATGEAGVQLPASGPPTVQLCPLGKVSVSTTLVESPVPLAVTVML